MTSLTITDDECLISVPRVIRYDVHEGISAEVLIEAIKALQLSGDRTAKILRQTLGKKIKCEQIVFTEIKENCIKINSVFKFVAQKDWLKGVDKIVEKAMDKAKDMSPKQLIVCGATLVGTATVAALSVTAVAYMGSNVLSSKAVSAENGSFNIVGDGNTVNLLSVSEEKILKQINDKLDAIPKPIAKKMASVIQNQSKKDSAKLKEEAVALYRPGGIMPASVNFFDEEEGVETEALHVGVEMLSQIPEKYEKEAPVDSECLMINVDLKVTKADDDNASKASWGATVTSNDTAESALLPEKRIAIEIPEDLVPKITYRQTQKATIRFVYRKVKNNVVPQYFKLESL